MACFGDATLNTVFVRWLQWFIAEKNPNIRLEGVKGESKTYGIVGKPGRDSVDEMLYISLDTLPGY